MNRVCISDIIKTLDSIFAAKKLHRTFSMLPAELIELFDIHFTLIEKINKIEESISDAHLLQELQSLKQNFEININIIHQIIRSILKCNIILYKVAEGDTLWKISKKFDVPIEDIAELNGIKNVLTLDKKKPLLVPLKNNQSET